MKIPGQSNRAAECGSVLIIVLWVALGLVLITLYFANSMSYELRAADNRVSGICADQAIEGGIRYVQNVLTTFATNGTVPDVTWYQSEAVPVGESHFWLIGRPVTYEVQPDQVFFGLIDEGARININYATLQTLQALTNMTLELAANTYDWRNTNGSISENGDGPTIYSQLNPSYMCKNSAFETIDELRLVYPMDLSLLFGEDLNLNGALDPSELDTNRNGVVDPGLLEFVTVYTKEPNTSPDGTQMIDVSNLSSSGTQLRAMLETNLTSARLTVVVNNLGLNNATGAAAGNTGGGRTGGATGGGGASTGGGRSGGAGGATGGAAGGGANQAAGAAAAAASTLTFASPLAFYLRSGMTPDEYVAVAPYITVTNAQVIYGRVNVNTAPAPVLACLPGIGVDLAKQLVNFRQQSPERLLSIAWLSEALGESNQDALQTLAATDCVTSKSYQFAADIAALGPHGRGYRRVRVVFDLSGGTPQVVYRQDLTHLGWALGRYVREAWGGAQTTDQMRRNRSS